MNLNQDVTAPVPIERPREAVMPLRVGIVYPLLLSTVWGIGIAMLVLLLLLLAEQVWDFRLSAKAYLLIWLVVLVVVVLLAWRNYVPSAMWLVEEMYRRDLNHDGYEGKPPPQTYTWEVQLDDNKLARLGDFTIPHKELSVIAEMVLQGGRNLSANSLPYRDAGDLIAAMIRAGLAERKHPKQPATLTYAGRAWFERARQGKPL